MSLPLIPLEISQTYSEFALLLTSIFAFEFAVFCFRDLLRAWRKQNQRLLKYAMYEGIGVVVLLVFGNYIAPVVLVVLLLNLISLLLPTKRKVVLRPLLVR